MIAIPAFLLSNLLVGAGLSLGGCAQPSDHPLALEQELPSKDAFAQKGTLLVHAEGQMAYRIAFSYHQENQDHYQMVLSPLFLSPITITLSGQDLILELSNHEYYNDEAKEILIAYLPDFPWEQIPSLVQTGELSHDSWKLDQWDSQQGFRVAYDDSTLEWRVKETRPLYRRIETYHSRSEE